ncbi:kallikrein 1-related peptidase b3-like isoform X2 [Octopus sinensis]|uniref:Kallikrein 1-related peptidase b3-like isoform X2 n=1 Tax=Octopus sinensis TaxID=2607531 RepID=A0A7E6FEH5_9MOLL|nr:kallikrein 1-related peptidase b3-like isoform X2 [Octopus sinensis]
MKRRLLPGDLVLNMKFLIVLMLYNFLTSLVQGATAKKKVETSPVIVDGKLSEEGRWPWMVSITAKHKRKAFNCGGMLITKYWVLTAAHCLYVNEKNNKLFSINNLKLVIGSVDIENYGPDTHVSEVSKYIHHPGFVMADLHKKNNDIALLKMSNPVPSKDFQPITIGPPNIPKIGDMCMAMGWGCAKYGTKQPTQNELYEVILPILSLSKCSKTFKELCSGNTSTKICAGYFERDRGICPGDSGGPLICRFKQKWVLSGITSFTLSHLPAIFTKVTSYEKWINETISNDFKENSDQLADEDRYEILPHYIKQISGN